MDFLCLSITDEQLTDIIKWLKFNVQPWTEVNQKWKSTSEFRVPRFHKRNYTITSYPILTNPKTDELVNKFDFEYVKLNLEFTGFSATYMAEAAEFVFLWLSRSSHSC